MWYASADWHLGHNNIIKYCKRPFISDDEKVMIELANRGTIPPRECKISKESTDAMDDAIINSTNAVVQVDDTLVLLGDFCSIGKHNRQAVIQNYRNRINCKNIIFICGNHDSRNDCKSVFNQVYDHYLFNVDGQHVFCSHYPSRSWDRAYYGAYMLYGHVHDLYRDEDNGKLSVYQNHILNSEFNQILDKHGVDKNSTIVDDLLMAVASLNGIDLTLDVGVDNTIRGENIPWGTPWSMHDIHVYMATKKKKWEERKNVIRQLVGNL
jgi:calcineurin-like phosphoesterase family protein